MNWPAIPASANQPFTAFPTDYSTLPDVSFVIPNLDHDMHDGTIAQGDTWLQANLGGYADWAKTHNSVLMVTWDEDDNSQMNQIPTVFVGQRVLPGQYSESINHYNVLRTLEDAFGLAPLGAAATAAPILDVWSSGSGGQPPVAAFTSSCTNLACAFDASGSADPDGTISSYAWTFGDTTTGTGATPSHTYGSAGTYTVTLTVTDNDGDTNAVSHPVSPTAPAGQPFASDGFNRTVSNGWGSAPTGGVWTTASGPSNFSVSPPTGGSMRTAAGSLCTGYLRSTSSTDTDLVLVVSIDKTPDSNGVYLTVVPRGVNSNTEYRARVRINSAVALRLTRLVAGTETVLVNEMTLAGLTYTAGTSLTIRVQAVGNGTTTLRARVWKTSSTEPSTWQASITDSTAALQTGGSVGLTSYLSSGATVGPTVLTVRSFTAQPTAG